MPAIATLRIDKAALMSSVFAPKSLYQTRDDELGPLRQVMAWLYEREGGVRFNQDNLRIGSLKKNYALLYYFEGKRYKVLWDGRAYISGADPEDMFEEDETDFQALIDTILAVELHKRFAKASDSIGARCGKAKTMSSEDGKALPMVAFGIVSDDLASSAS